MGGGRRRHGIHGGPHLLLKGQGSGPPRSCPDLLAPESAFKMLAFCRPPNPAVSPNPDLWEVVLARRGKITPPICCFNFVYCKHTTFLE